VTSLPPDVWPDAKIMYETIIYQKPKLFGSIGSLVGVKISNYKISGQVSSSKCKTYIKTLPPFLVPFENLSLHWRG